MVVPKVKPALPDGLPEQLLSKITLLEMVCICVIIYVFIKLMVCKDIFGFKYHLDIMHTCKHDHTCTTCTFLDALSEEQKILKSSKE